MTASRFFSRIAAALAFAALGAWAQAGPPYAKLDQPQPTEGNGKIEVTEFFWYGCPHCYAMEPAVNAWLKTKPADVEFRRVPAIPSESWGEVARMFYTLEAMGKMPEFHDKVFDAVHKDHVNMLSKGKREDWLKANGIDVAQYESVEKSFSVVSKLARARQLTQAYKVDSVPRFFVGGKYYTSGEQAGGNDKIFSTVDLMIAQVRKEKH